MDLSIQCAIISLQQIKMWDQAFDVPMINYNESKFPLYKEGFKWLKKMNTKHILPTNETWFLRANLWVLY